MFHPIIQNWFTEKYGIPTDIRKQSWPRIAAGEHLFITPPTASSKPLTAFLWYINGQPATMSPYLSVIENSFNLFRDYKSVIIQREL